MNRKVPARVRTLMKEFHSWIWERGKDYERVEFLDAVELYNCICNL